MKTNDDPRVQLELVGNRLRVWRKARGIKLVEFAKGVGIKSLSVLVEIEKGCRGPSRDVAVLIENATEGAVLVEQWSSDPAVVLAAKANAARRAARREARSSTSSKKASTEQVSEGDR